MSIGMRAIRGFARLAPRASTVLQTAARPARFAPSAVSKGLSLSRPAVAHFSASTFKCDVSHDLASKLQEEIDHETTTAELGDRADFVDVFGNLSFKLEDVAGRDEVVLTRHFDGEEIKVTFSVSDIHNAESSDLADEADSAMFDEPLPNEAEPETKQNKQVKNTNINVDAEAGSFDDHTSFACRVNIQVTKSGKEGVLHINAIAEDGEFLIDTMPFYAAVDGSSKSSSALVPEDDSQYIGPPFSNLDEDLQMLVTQYLEERSIGTDLALLIPEYIEYKEQREYVQWLANLKEFIQK